MARRNRYDAVIIGARCAGAATAMLMARRGLKVLAVDRGAYGSDTLSTHALMRGGVLQLHRWGLLPRLIAAGTPPVRTTNFHYGDEVVPVAIKPAHGVDALYAPRRTLLDSLMVDAAREAGAEIRHETVLESLVRDDDGRVMGATLTSSGRTSEAVQADLVVGADGTGSRVAREVDAPIVCQARDAAITLYAYWSGVPDGGYHWAYRPGVSAGVIPTNGGQTCIFAAMTRRRYVASIRDGRQKEGYRAVIAEAAPDLADRLAAARLETRINTFAGRKGYLRKPCGPGWALVGDAGYFKDPITAHGITDALRDADLLAEAAARGTRRAFAAYAGTRDALSRDLFDVTDAIAAFDWDLESLKMLHRRLNTAMKDEVDYLAGLDTGWPTTIRLPASQAPAVPLQI
ncbi:MAG: NAD(P)/FAD-dependent oxidoreductase [Alphaproteobacteria bacterium]|jgi:flavin-dependent dehydrogenase|nr:NAD(P)/FAD-dependent oxidoreductase [Alphaproteobacteria bacterium]